MDSFSRRDQRSIVSIVLGVLASFSLVIALILITHRGELLQTERAREMGIISENTALLSGTAQRIALLQYGLLDKQDSAIATKINLELQRETNKFLDVLKNLQDRISRSEIISSATKAAADQWYLICQQFIDSSLALTANVKDQGIALRFADLTTKVSSSSSATQRLIAEDVVQSAASEVDLLAKLHRITVGAVVVLGLLVLLFVAFRLSDEFRKRRRSEAELSRRNQELEQFSASVAHDLRGPLNNLNIVAQMFAGETMDLAGVREQLVPLIGRETKRLREMVTALLQLSRTGNTPLSLKKVKLSELVDDIKTGMFTQIQAASASIEVTRDEFLKVDVTLFQSVLQNLIENSLKYKRPEVSPQITLSSRHLEDGSTEIVYDDNGIGIPSNLRERVFEAFFQSDQHQEGLGLGLSLVRKILRLHGASISIQDKTEDGTRFAILIPQHRGGWILKR